MRISSIILWTAAIALSAGCSTASVESRPVTTSGVTEKWTGIYSYGAYKGTVDLTTTRDGSNVRGTVAFSGMPGIAGGQLVDAKVQGNSVSGTVAGGSTNVPFNMTFDGDRASGNIGQGSVSLERVR